MSTNGPYFQFSIMIFMPGGIVDKYPHNVKNPVIVIFTILTDHLVPICQYPARIL